MKGISICRKNASSPPVTPPMPLEALNYIEPWVIVSLMVVVKEQG